jgi:hypothetical protein
METTTQTEIKASELRIGNYVESYGGLIMCTGLFHDRFFYVSVDPHKGYLGDTAFHMLQPIPLTPEILEKAGFVYMTEPNENYWNYNKPDVYLYLNEKLEPGLYSNEYEHVDVIGNPLQYVHQLQNLYFALTGEELTVNL